MKEMGFRQQYGGALLLMLACLGAPPAHAAAGAAVETVTAKPGSLAERITAYGSLASSTADTHVVAMPFDGFVETLPARVGETVKRGQVLATLGASPAASAQYAQARNAARYAEKDLARVKRLHDLKLASNDLLASAEKTWRDAEAQLRAQRRMGTGAKSETVRAPVDGVITALSARRGEQIRAGTALATVGSLKHLVVNLGLEPDDAGKLRPGAVVQLTSPLEREARFHGRLVAIGSVIDPNSRLVPGVAELERPLPPHPLLGSTLIAHIALPLRRGILLPRGAILEDSEGTYVFTVEQGRAVRRAITLAAENDSQALVAKGLSPGERVVVSGNAALEEGMPVREVKP